MQKRRIFGGADRRKEEEAEEEEHFTGDSLMDLWYSRRWDAQEEAQEEEAAEEEAEKEEVAQEEAEEVEEDTQMFAAAPGDGKKQKKRSLEKKNLGCMIRIARGIDLKRTTSFMGYYEVG